MDLSCSRCDGHTEGGVAVGHRDANLKTGGLALDVARHEGLAGQSEAGHLCLDAAPAVISAPSSPDGTARLLRGAQGFVSGHGARARGLPRFGGPAGRDDGGCVSSSDCRVTLPAVAGAVSRHGTGLLFTRDPVRQFWRHGRVADTAAGDLPSRQICVANRLPGNGRPDQLQQALHEAGRLPQRAASRPYRDQTTLSANRAA